MRHTISVTVENKFGVLARVSGLFSARGYNISSLAVSETLDPAISCMTIVVEAKDELVLEQIKKQLNKLIDVITVTDYTKKDHVERELVLAKVACPAKEKARLERVLKKYVAKIIQFKDGKAFIEVVGQESQIHALLEAMKDFGIAELIRTGKIAIA
jgi:acetolactate synthase-1/3 small subunit